MELFFEHVETDLVQPFVENLPTAVGFSVLLSFVILVEKSCRGTRHCRRGSLLRNKRQDVGKKSQGAHSQQEFGERFRWRHSRSVVRCVIGWVVWEAIEEASLAFSLSSERSQSGLGLTPLVFHCCQHRFVWERQGLCFSLSQRRTTMRKQVCRSVTTVVDPNRSQRKPRQMRAS